METVFAVRVVDEPALVGVAVFEVTGYEREYVAGGFDDSIEQTVGGFLKADEGFHTMGFASYTFGGLLYVPYCGVEQIGFDVGGAGEGVAYKTEQGIVHAIVFREEGFVEAFEAIGRKAFFEALQYAGCFCFVGYNVMGCGEQRCRVGCIAGKDNVFDLVIVDVEYGGANRGMCHRKVQFAWVRTESFAVRSWAGTCSFAM